jgi:iron(II)-dependent oxidoreductase
VSVSGGVEPPLGSVPAAQAATTVTAAKRGVQWVLVPGGRLDATDWCPETRVPDLFWSVTPVTEERGRRPATGMTLDEAQIVARQMGARLPTAAEWEWMAGAGERTYPWGEEEPFPERANLRGLGPGTTTPVGSYLAGATPDGVLDVAGNVWEWTTAPWRRDRVALLRGGSYNSLTLYARCGYANDVPPDLVSPGIGFRVVRPA